MPDTTAGARHRLTLGQIHDLPVSLDIVTAGRMLGIGRTRAYKMAAARTFPVRVIPIGRGYRVPTAELLRVLGIDLAGPADRHTDTAVGPITLKLIERSDPTSNDLT
ncbi:hypothetical protein ABH935_007065 [Catenulispora sp. GAS73]|uniref:hypothetical protein n=1 Tax=Catenulispora sp. GAS73 TaxID=3156269 RepID=UPI00351300DF